MPVKSREFTRAELEQLGAPFNLPKDTVLLDRLVSSNRWRAKHQLVFRLGADVWAVTYYVGLSDKTTQTFRSETVTATAMEQRQVTITRWLPVHVPDTAQ